MSNLSPENEVKLKCLSRLEQWLQWGVVVDYDDVSNLGRHMSLRTGHFFMNTKVGKRDVIVHFKVKRALWVYLIECKAPDGGVWSKDQQAYAQKYEGLDNVLYEVVSNASQIDITLDKITERTKALLDEGDRHLFPIVEEELF